LGPGANQKARTAPDGPLREDGTAMALPKNILVPVDFSEASIVALDRAVELAAKLDARIHLLNVVGVMTLSAEFGLAVTQPVLDSIVQGAQKELDRLVAERTGKAHFAPTILELGDARSAIDQTAEKVGADLIVMGTHGRRGMKRLVLGSVAEHVARVARCPVMLVRPQVAAS
jgi:nucleotide-binding universal stress UspA family protein